MASKSFCQNSSKLNKFLRSEEFPRNGQELKMMHMASKNFS
jgi:hypothetical protein